MRFESIKGIQQLSDLAFGLLILAVSFGIALLVLSKFSDQLPVNSTAKNATDTLSGVLKDTVGWVGLVVIIIIVVIMLGYLNALRGRQGRR
jgi:quinol-cytochrome oxidoreductase complex cytochrome b subunit